MVESSHSEEVVMYVVYGMGQGALQQGKVYSQH